MAIIFAILIAAFTIGGLYGGKTSAAATDNTPDDGVDDPAALAEAERQAAGFVPTSYIVVAQLPSQQGYDEAVVNGLIAFLGQNAIKSNYVKHSSGSIGTDIFQIKVAAEHVESAAPLIEKYLNEN